MTAHDSTGKTAAPSMSAFVRGFPHDTPTDDIIAKGREAGIELQRKYIWNVQSLMRTKGPKASSNRKSKPGRKAKAKTTKARVKKKGSARANAKKEHSVNDAGDSAQLGTRQVARGSHTAATNKTRPAAAEQRMRALIIELGTVRAEEIFRSVKRQLEMLAGRS